MWSMHVGFKYTLNSYSESQELLEDLYIRLLIRNFYRNLVSFLRISALENFLT